MPGHYIIPTKHPNLPNHPQDALGLRQVDPGSTIGADAIIALYPAFGKGKTPELGQGPGVVAVGALLRRLGGAIF
jgi:hypothetical protein